MNFASQDAPQDASVPIWKDLRIIPVYVSAVSAALLLLFAISGALRTRSEERRTTGGLRAHVDRHGGRRIYGFKLARAACVLALLCSYGYELAHGGNVHGRGRVALAVFLAYIYASGLALLNVAASASLAHTAAPHLVFILLASCAVYGFRDVWPLATYTMQPLDAAEGATLWVKIMLLVVAGVVIPLTVPRQYVPVDPENPSEKPNPEQTCSLLSLVTYHFLDKPIFAAYNSPKGGPSALLPELADYDRADYLVQHSFRHLDVFSGARRQHMFMGLMKVFWRDYLQLFSLLVLRAFTPIFAPVGINRLLSYIEDDGKGATVRPWFWCLLMLLGPVTGSLVSQYYTYVSTGMLVRFEGILTQLIFEHALRLRVKFDVSSQVDSSSPPGSSKSAEATRKADDFSGRINSLVTTDLSAIGGGRNFASLVLYYPASFAVSVYFLYQLLGWSTFVGVALMIASFPVPGYLAKLMQGIQKTLAKNTDARVQSAVEMMSALRMIKQFGWETRTASRLNAKRVEELHWLRLSLLVDLGNDVVGLIIPALQMVAIYGVFTLVAGGQLTPSVVFPSISVFLFLQGQMSMFFQDLSPVIKAKVSLDRVTEFLRDTELLDHYTSVQKDAAPRGLAAGPADASTLGIRNASFSWSAAAADGTATPSQGAFTLRVDGELTFKRGVVNFIVGPTGSGKTSLLMALLGEMHYVPLTPDAWVSLPRAGGVAYAAQESWVQNETIRDNILFGAPYDEARYKKVIYQCGLKRDLSLFDAGDKTEVGEKGLTLSGGQKARVTLARAIYSSADIILLDDVLAALDVHTAKWIVDKCLKGDLVRGRTVIFVTHNVVLARPIVDFVVSLGTDGTIAARGSYREVLAKDKTLAEEAAKDTELLADADDDVEDAEDLGESESKSDGKLIVQEEVAVGHISKQAFSLFASAIGGRYPIFFWISYFASVFAYQGLTSLQAYWLGRWAGSYSNPGSGDVTYYLVGFVLIVLGTVLVYTLAITIWVFGVVRASSKIHVLFMNSILGSTFRWLDTTPVARVITRCTKDVKAVDGRFAQELEWWLNLTAQLATQLVAITLVAPRALFFGIFVFSIGVWLGKIYLAVQLPVKRAMSNKKAPVLSHFSAAITGLTSIRAYGAEQAFRRESYKRIEDYTRSGRVYWDTNRWIGFRGDSLGGLFSSSLGLYMVYAPKGAETSVSNVGFSLVMATSFSNMIIYWIRYYNRVEVEGNSLERIYAYMEIEQEPKPTKEKLPPAAWPASGSLRVEGLSARYSPDGPKVLHDLSFTVSSGERVGIVGRTGSGKSSLTLSLLRCIYIDGGVYYDGVDTAKLNLDVLRTNVTIIPQVPELLSGTLRENLDPFGEHDDAVLNGALRASGLFSLQSETDEGRITLDSQIAGGGGNLSVGQRQILALARALVRGSKLLILDEATSSIDYETDSIIQSSLRNELGGDVTLLTVAHRLQTIMDADKIMVLDAGRIVEYDSPKTLLQKEAGFLKSLVDESGDKDALYAMAGSAL